MSGSTSSWLLLLVPAWPLLLALAAAVGATRPLALRLLPWAALPALAAVGMPDTGLQLGSVLLRSVLVLDAAGRVFLLLISGLWLATGLLLRARPHSSAFPVLLLLAMAGGLGMALAGDALLFYTASTLAGYALYGVLVDGAEPAMLRAGRVFVVLLVVSDLLVFELLLLLGQAAAGMDFPALRQAFLAADNRGLLLGLLVAGFGIKVGLLGFHVWLPPMFVTAAAALRPALVAYMLGAGLLGALRLLPLGEFEAPVAAGVLCWLAWATLAYAGLAGLLQAHGRSLLGYAALALGGVWLAVVSELLRQPLRWEATAGPLAALLLQSGCALVALLLMPGAADGRRPAWHGRLAGAADWLAALLLATAPVGLTRVIGDGAALPAIYLAVAVIAVLAAGSVLRRGHAAAAPRVGSAQDGAAGQVSPGLPMPTRWMTAVALVVAGALAAGYRGAGLALDETALATATAVLAMLLAALSTKFVTARLPSLPPGDVLAVIRRGMTAAGHAGRGLNERSLARLPATARALAQRLWKVMSGLPAGQWEAALGRWPVAVVLMVLLGLLTVWVGG